MLAVRCFFTDSAEKRLKPFPFFSNFAEQRNIMINYLLLFLILIKFFSLRSECVKQKFDSILDEIAFSNFLNFKYSMKVKQLNVYDCMYEHNQHTVITRQNLRVCVYMTGILSNQVNNIRADNVFVFQS